VGIEITAAGEAGSHIRLGVYADDGSGYQPGALLTDAGQIDGTSATYQELSISVPVANQQIWTAVVVQDPVTSGGGVKAA
jgi:hypothetical protein